MDRNLRAGEDGILTPEDYRRAAEAVDPRDALIDAQEALIVELRLKVGRLERRNSDLELRLRGVPAPGP